MEKGEEGCEEAKGGVETLQPGLTFFLAGQAHPQFCTHRQGSVSKDESLFLEGRFISFHSNCLPLSWACSSAGLCYKKAPQAVDQTWLLLGWPGKPRCPAELDRGHGREGVLFCRVRHSGSPRVWEEGLGYDW